MSGSLALVNLDVLPRSVAFSGRVEWGLARTAEGLRLVVTAPVDSEVFQGLEGAVTAAGGVRVLVGPTSARNAAALRAVFPWLVPEPLGLRTSAGMGDRPFQ